MARVTQRLLSSASLSALQHSLSRTQGLQERLATGRSLNRPSDSPTGLVTAMQTRSSLSRTDQHIKNADNAVAWLNSADASLQSATSSIRRARDLTLQGDNASVGPGGREAIAAEIDIIREGLLDLANTRYAGRLIFAGHADVASTFDAAGVYQGDAGTVNRTLAEGEQVQINVVGSDVFGSGPGSLFGVLDAIATDLRTNPGTAVANNLDDLDARLDDVLTALGDIGARTNRVEQMRERSVSADLTLTTQLSEVESIDLPETIMELQLQEVAYQAALSATSRVIQPSLLDFLR